MKRIFVLFIIVITVTGFAFAKENLAILPFTGGLGEEGETIAERFSFVPRLGDFFNIIPRTSISRAIIRERRFQMDSGMTDPDTIVSIANEVGARYAVAGSITSVGNNNLLVVSIIDIRNLQQIAGDYQSYPRGRIEELLGKLPNMAENIIQATLTNTAALPKLAIVPVQLVGGTDRRVADTLAQLLAIHLIRSGNYAVFPRTESLEQVQAEHDAQMIGHTADGNIIGIGHGENPDFVLSVVARSLGNVNMFNASIIDLMTRIQTVGRSVDYQDINDGMRAMEDLSIVLTSTAEQMALRQQEAEDLRREEERQKQTAERKDSFWKNSGLGLGILGGAFMPIYSGELDWFHFMISAVAELKLGQLFSIQLEIQNQMGWMNPFLEVPVLAKFNFSRGNFVFSPFLGLSFHKARQFSFAESSSPPLISGILGIDGGIKLGKTRRWVLFADLRYSIDFGKYEYGPGTVGFGKEFTYSLFAFSLGAKYIIPFRKE